MAAAGAAMRLRLGLALFAAALSLACLVVYADDDGAAAAPRKKIVRRILGRRGRSMRFLGVVGVKSFMMIGNSGRLTVVPA